MCVGQTTGKEVAEPPRGPVLVRGPLTRPELYAHGGSRSISSHVCRLWIPFDAGVAKLADAQDLKVFAVVRKSAQSARFAERFVRTTWLELVEK
jgi:hypothetical protein